MEKVIIASMRKSAGKTSAIVGITAATKKKIAYVKPFGERMLYRKKRLWDYDSSLISALFGLKEDPVDMSIGSTTPSFATCTTRRGPARK